MKNFLMALFFTALISSLAYGGAQLGGGGGGGTGTGDFTGPAASTDGNFVAFDGIDGKTGKDSGYKASDFQVDLGLIAGTMTNGKYCTYTTAGTLISCNSDASGYTNLTSFIAQTAWRAFYSNGDGDVTELALGADTTWLRSNGSAAAPTWNTAAQMKSALGYYTSGDTILTAGITMSKTTGVAGSMGVYEANSTDTSTIGWLGPSSIASSWWYQFNSTAPTGGQVMVFGVSTGSSGPNGDAVSAVTWASLSDYAPLNSPSLTTPNIGAATGTSLAVTGRLDGLVKVEKANGKTIDTLSGYFIVTGGSSAFYLPTPGSVGGNQYCFKQGNAGNIGIRISPINDSGVMIEKQDHSGYCTADDLLVSSGGTTDSACLVSIDATHYDLFPAVGTWTCTAH